MSGVFTSRVLLVGESCMRTSILQKGFDTITTSDYREEAGEWCDRLRARGHHVEYVPAHGASTMTPATAAGWSAYDVVVISDVGANSFLLGAATLAGTVVPNRLEQISGYVAAGGGLIMVGGWMSFAGFEGKARYGVSPLAECLPVLVAEHDDRVEVPEGVSPTLVGTHEITTGLPDSWPAVLGYNALRPKPETETIVSLGDDPLLTVGSFGDGRVAAYSSDLTAHWAPATLTGWEPFAEFWDRLIRWCAR